MIIFTLDCKLKFEAITIKEARAKIKQLNFLLNNLHNTQIEIAETERLFDKGDL